MKFWPTATPIAAAAPFVPPAPMPRVAATTVATIVESLSAARPRAPSAWTVLPPVIAAFAWLRMLLTEIAPPPAIAMPVSLAAAIDTLAATEVAVIEASSEAVSPTEPSPSAVTVEASIPARTSLAILLTATETPTDRVAALSPSAPAIASAAPTAVADTDEVSIAVSVTSPGTPSRPFAVTVLPFRITAWMSVSIVLAPPAPAPASAPALPDVEPAPVADPAIASASLLAVVVASRVTLPAAVTRELSIAATTERPSRRPISLSEPEAPSATAPDLPEPRLAAIAIAKPPASARTDVSSLAVRVTSPAVASTLWVPLQSLM